MIGRRMYGGTSTYIPLKVNQAGIIPVIFASSLLYLPALATQIGNSTSSWSIWVQKYFVRGDHPFYMASFFLLIVFFAFFYVAITFNPARARGQHEEVRRLHPRHPGRAGRPRSTWTTC